jgi:hypothetical protein
MSATEIRNTVNGDYIKRTPTAKGVYVRGEYVKQKKSFACHAFDDISKVIYIKANKVVFVDFTF